MCSGKLKLPKYIYKTYDGRYEIRKRINKKLTYWGRFQTLKKAMREIKIIMSCNWDINLLVEYGG